MSARIQLPGVVGSSPTWLRACHEVEAAFEAGEWLAVQGEPGVGKLALLKSVHLHREPKSRFLVVDATPADNSPPAEVMLAAALGEDAETIVIRHIDKLDGRRLADLVRTLTEERATVRDRRRWIAVTLGYGAKSKDLGQMLGLFPKTVELPPLRLHIEDLHQLVPFFLSRIGHGSELDCSAEAMRLLTRSYWPGNAEQLHQMLRQVVKHRRTGSIQPTDLPPEAWTVSRRLLSPLESIERDAIVQSLLDRNGDKAEAARALGISRATIYRKIREYGVMVTPS